MTTFRPAPSSVEQDAMSNPVTEFLAGLPARGHEPLLEKTRGRVCLEVVDGDDEDHWLVCIENGDIDVVSGDVGADCTFRASREVLDRIVRGEMNAMAAVLRGAVTVDGNWELLVRFQRLFPPSTRDGGRADAVGAAVEHLA
jgi:putative sterol carrier protein